MRNLESVFHRCDQWLDHHQKPLSRLLLTLPVVVYGIAYYLCGSAKLAVVWLLFSPLLFIMATAMLGLILVPPLVLIDRLAEMLAQRGWPYWGAFVCMAPLGIPVAIVMVLLIDWSLGMMEMGWLG
jgi:hypothetical protein